MAFDPSGDVSNLCSDGEIASLFIWDKDVMVMRELKAKGGELQKVQLMQWRICGSYVMIYCWQSVTTYLLAQDLNL